MALRALEDFAARHCAVPEPSETEIGLWITEAGLNKDASVGLLLQRQAFSDAILRLLAWQRSRASVLESVPEPSEQEVDQLRWHLQREVPWRQGKRPDYLGDYTTDVVHEVIKWFRQRSQGAVPPETNIVGNSAEGPLATLERLRELAACCYQFVGAHMGPNTKTWLDALSAAADGRPFSTDGLLPYLPQQDAAPAPETHEPLEWGTNCPNAPDSGPHECAGHNLICAEKKQHVCLRCGSLCLCKWCNEGNPRVRSSVSDKWVHTDTQIGRQICVDAPVEDADLDAVAQENATRTQTSAGSVDGPQEETEKPLYDLVDRFSRALLQKLIASEKKYEFGNGWLEPLDTWDDPLQDQLVRHVEKGDPLDVAAYCAFAWHHHASTTPAPKKAAPDPRLAEAEQKLYKAYEEIHARNLHIKAALDLLKEWDQRTSQYGGLSDLRLRVLALTPPEPPKPGYVIEEANGSWGTRRKDRGHSASFFHIEDYPDARERAEAECDRLNKEGRHGGPSEKRDGQR